MQRGWLAERRRVQGERAQGWGGEWALREAAKLRHLTAGGGREEVGIQLLGAMRYGLPVVVRQRLMLRV